jgi:hypothetical protein
MARLRFYDKGRSSEIFYYSLRSRYRIPEVSRLREGADGRAASTPMNRPETNQSAFRTGKLVVNVIGTQLDMRENTVKMHARNILGKLNAANRTHAAFVANRLLGHDAEPVALPSPLRLID